MSFNDPSDHPLGKFPFERLFDGAEHSFSCLLRDGCVEGAARIMMAIAGELGEEGEDVVTSMRLDEDDSYCLFDLPGSPFASMSLSSPDRQFEWAGRIFATGGTAVVCGYEPCLMTISTDWRRPWVNGVRLMPTLSVLSVLKALVSLRLTFAMYGVGQFVLVGFSDTDAALLGLDASALYTPLRKDGPDQLVLEMEEHADIGRSIIRIDPKLPNRLSDTISHDFDAPLSREIHQLVIERTRALDRERPRKST